MWVKTTSNTRVKGMLHNYQGIYCLFSLHAKVGDCNVQIAHPFSIEVGRGGGSEHSQRQQ